MHAQGQRLFVPSLALVLFAEQDLNLLLSLFLLDIALTFGVSVGTASQIGMVSSVVTMVVGLLMSIFSVRFGHKSLLLVGGSIIIVGVLGCFFAPTFVVMQFFYPFDGVGSAIVAAMAYALIGRFLPLEKRSEAIGWGVCAGALAYVIGAPLGGLIAGFGSWRSILLWFFLPVSIVGLVLAYFGVPSASNKQQVAIGKEAYLSSLKQFFFNKSAVACLTGTMFFLLQAPGPYLQ